KNTSGWEDLVRRVSLPFKEYPEIEKSKVRIVGDRFVRHYLDSEGNKIRDAVRQYAIFLEAWTKTESGSQLYDQDTLFFTDPENFPSEKELIEKVDRLIQGLLVLKKAPKIQPYVGPAIFSPDATAVLFHEAIGHRLEGDRLRTANDGKTFMKKIGERILPPFLTLVDNPRLETFKGEKLLGHYLYDDEGQESQEVVLVNRGVLKNFLLSRTPILSYSKTNGHARSDGVKAPMSRMSNFILRSENKVGLDELKRKLIEEVKRQRKPYGLLIKKIIGGETQTERNNFQVFKGKPLYLYKVYPEDGREELVRSVEFVGTPLSMVNKVILTGDDETAIHGYCGAESGIIPVTSITPSVLLSEVELQIANEPRLRLPILPPPPVQHISH
ncbi:MAG: TldD/PmbA family protein, partial [Nitrospinales bacterium]